LKQPNRFPRNLSQSSDSAKLMESHEIKSRVTLYVIPQISWAHPFRQ
jgi:hypothetical protein